ncbi:histone deacetylase 11 [Musca vetustissima]|uniref:histone deacetylase 11 n=1 Tax=Musca vetustissima TaxID=27455 RepID=UPI002AB7C005|nr:histone deacetylase 11 [Musca vetustissima]
MQKYTEKVHSEREQEPEIVWIKRTSLDKGKKSNHSKPLNKTAEETEDQGSEGDDKLPIVYSKNYGVHFAKLEKLHPFDAEKGKNIQELLIKFQLIDKGKFYEPSSEITKDELLKVHTEKYLRSLKWSFNAAKIAEIPILLFLPNCWVQCGYLRPMRFQTAGSIMAGKLALEYGWAINLGGGFHHCCSYKGGGFCPYADITLLIQRIFAEEEHVRNVMIVDLDAHQGNGHERDFMDNPFVYIMDMYNYQIYPKDHNAKLAIRYAVELKPRTENKEYLAKLKRGLKFAMREFKPHLVVYNAGTDILEGDPLGYLSITPEGVIERDQYVFGMCRARGIPIVMLLSGGYLKLSAKVIADSIMNLKRNGLLLSIR